MGGGGGLWGPSEHGVPTVLMNSFLYGYPYKIKPTVTFNTLAGRTTGLSGLLGWEWAVWKGGHEDGYPEGKYDLCAVKLK